MKRFLIIFGLLIFGLPVLADEEVLSGGVVFDWVDLSQIQRDETIAQYKAKLFDETEISKIKKREFKDIYANYLKDEKYREHYRLAKMGQTETSEANLCAFFYKNEILLIYALQYKNDLRHIYYYNAYGRLQYVDEISENYPNFPYSSKQIKKNGKIISAIYFTSSEIQYMFEPNGDFKGVWYKEKMYDRHGKQRVERSNWGI